MNRRANYFQYYVRAYLRSIFLITVTIKCIQHRAELFHILDFAEACCVHSGQVLSVSVHELVGTRKNMILKQRPLIPVRQTKEM